MTACAPLWGKPNLKVDPERCPVEASAAVPETPRVPDGAGFPLPVTPAERAAVALYGAWLTSFGADDAVKTDRLRRVKGWCEAR
jgi:hypothetical protein